MIKGIKDKIESKRGSQNIFWKFLVSLKDSLFLLIKSFSGDRFIKLDDMMKIYSGYLSHSSDETIRFSASSGGFCKSFLVYLIEQKIVDKAIITRTGSSDFPLKPETIITSDIKDIISTRTNSVYAPADPLSVLDKLDDNKKYVFVGLPCHCLALENMQKRGLYTNVILKISLFCNYTPNLNFTMSILHDLGLKESQLSSIEYRGQGWPGYFTAYLKNGLKKSCSINNY